MTLRQKTLLVVGTTLLGLAAVLYAILARSVRRSFAELEERDTREDVTRVLHGFQDSVDRLDFISRDYAEWNDTYTFAQDGNRAYIETNVTELALANLGLDLSVYLNRDCRLLYGTGLDLETRRRTP